MKLQKKFATYLIPVMLLSPFAIVYYFSQRESKRHFEQEKELWRNLGEIYVSNWKSIMVFTGSDHLTGDQLFKENNIPRSVSLKLACSPRLFRINEESSSNISTEW